jgi:hypothetical protein
MSVLDHPNTSGKVTTLLVAAYCLWNALRGLSTGSVWLGWGLRKRSEETALFWFGVGVHLLGGVAFVWRILSGMNLLQWL